jgi:carbonic anhydrase
MFATCLNCMDGRVQLPVIKWIMENYNIKYVDMITEARMDGYLADKDSDTKDILKKVEISINLHESKNIFITGHHDCAGNPIDNTTHKKQITAAVYLIKKLFPDLNIISLWIDDNFRVENIIGI